MDPYIPELHQPEPEHGRPVVRVLMLTIVIGLAGVCILKPQAVRAAVEEIETILALKSTPAPASPAKFSTIWPVSWGP